MILVYVLLGIIFLIILLIFYLRHKSFKINPEDGWIKIKSSNRFYKAYLIHEKPTAGRVVLFLTVGMETIKLGKRKIVTLLPKQLR